MARLRSVRGGNSVPYHPNRRKLIQLSSSGFAGTMATLFLSAVFSIAGWSSTDFGALFGSYFTRGAPPLVSDGTWWLGLTLYLALGTFAFPLCFDYLCDRKVLTNHRWAKGFMAGLLVWILFEAFLKPLAGMGFFSLELPAPFAAMALSLVIWFSYALVFEQSSRVRLVHDLRLVEDQAA